MSASVARYSSEPLPASSGSPAVALLIRLPLLAVTVIFTLIAIRYLTDPVRTAAAAGITFTSPGGITVARIGFGAFPLGFVAFFLTCLFSPRRILLGLRIELALLAIVIAVRIAAMAAAHSTETATLLVPEVVIAAFCVLAVRLELNRRKAGRLAAASFGK